MGKDGKVIGLVGSPNREGRTNQLVAAALEVGSEIEFRRRPAALAEPDFLTIAPEVKG